MLVTVDVLKLRRRRDTVSLLRRPRRRFAGSPEFARSLLRARNWRSSDLREAVVIAAWEDAPGDLALDGVVESWRGVFEVQRGHGSLHGSDPLGPASAGSPNGPGVIWTAGNVKLRRLPRFLRRNDAVVRELRRAPGLLEDFGVLGLWKQGPWMCTLSFWEDLDQGLAFAYRSSPHHRDAVKQMRAGDFGTGETYFARLGLVASSGAIDGRDPFRAGEAVAA
jgi:hypothetical protein